MGDSDLLPYYAGFTLEYGNVFQTRSDIEFENGIAAGSVFLGVDTFIGPIYLAYGYAEGGRDNVYFVLGQQPRRQRRTGFVTR